MSDFATLFCLVYGQPSKRAFPVKIERGESVGVLQELVKEKKKPTLDHVPADALDLWQVSILQVDDEGLNDFVLDDSKMLRSTREISSVFEGDPLRGHIHIIVRVPGGK